VSEILAKFSSQFDGFSSAVSVSNLLASLQLFGGNFQLVRCDPNLFGGIAGGDKNPYSCKEIQRLKHRPGNLPDKMPVSRLSQRVSFGGKFTPNQPSKHFVFQVLESPVIRIASMVGQKLKEGNPCPGGWGGWSTPKLRGRPQKAVPTTNEKECRATSRCARDDSASGARAGQATWRAALLKGSGE